MTLSPGQRKDSATRSRGVLRACLIVCVLVVCGLMMACAKTPKVVRDLPELPSELARDLAPARTAPVLMTKPALSATPAAPPPASPPLPLQVARACTLVWSGFVTYPVTVCYPPNEQVEGLVLTQDTGTPSPGADHTKVLPVRYYKLTSHPRAAFASAFCSVRGGPWFGRVEGKQFCGANPNIRVFTAEILGAAPEPIVVQWTGTLADVPPPLDLVSGTEKESCICCSGVTCPDGSCKPSFKLCGTMPPALK